MGAYVAAGFSPASSDRKLPPRQQRRVDPSVKFGALIGRRAPRMGVARSELGGQDAGLKPAATKANCLRQRFCKRVFTLDSHSARAGQRK